MELVNILFSEEEKDLVQPVSSTLPSSLTAPSVSELDLTPTPAAPAKAKYRYFIVENNASFRIYKFLRIIKYLIFLSVQQTRVLPKARRSCGNCICKRDTQAEC